MKKNRIQYPEYWAKRKKRLSQEFIDKLQATVDSDPVATDEFGSYRVGTFLFRSAIVTVAKMDGLWNIHIYSENPISQLMIEEIKRKYVPDQTLMAHIYSSREQDAQLQGVMLNEIPSGYEEDVEVAGTEQ